MKMKNFSDLTHFVTFYSSFFLTVLLLVQGLPFILKSSNQHCQVLYEVLVSAFCTLVMDYLVEHFLNTSSNQIVGLDEFIIAMHEKLKSHPIISFLVHSSPPVISMQLIVDRPWAMGAVTVSLFIFVMSGCSLYTTPRAAAIVAHSIMYVPVILVGPVISGRSNMVVLGLLFLLAICCQRSIQSGIKEMKEQTELEGGTHPESKAELLQSLI